MARRIATLPRLPPTHLEYSFGDSLAFAVRGLEVRGLAVTNVSGIMVVGGSICRILGGSEALGAPDSYRLLTALRVGVGPLKNLSRAGLPFTESSGSCGALGEVCGRVLGVVGELWARFGSSGSWICPVSYTNLRAHET